MGCERWKVRLCLLENAGYVHSLHDSSFAYNVTIDDRFIAKELSRAELQAMETFAPSYFDYMSSAVVANVCLIDSQPILMEKRLTFLS